MNAKLLILTGVALCALSAQASRAQDYAQATFAGGCFWCIEAPFDKVEGVVSAVSGYTAASAKTQPINKSALVGPST